MFYFVLFLEIKRLETSLRGLEKNKKGHDAMEERMIKPRMGLGVFAKKTSFC